MATVSASPSTLHNPVMGALGLKRSDSLRGPPIYDVPYGSVQLAGPSASGIAGFDLAAAGFTAAAEYEGIEDEEDEEGDGEGGDEDDDSSEDGSSKAKGGKGKGGGRVKGGKGKKAKTEAKGEKDAKTGRRKIKIEFIEDDARRHITFSKRKAGIMKKAYELATLTGTQVLLLVVSQTGLVYTFTTPKLQALVTQAEGRNLIQSCLNAPDPVAGSGDGSEDGTPGEEGEDGSQDDNSRPGSSGGASMKGKTRPAKAREIMTGPNRDFKKRPRNNSTSKASSMSQGGEVGGDDGGANKRGRGRPRKDTNASASGAYEGDAAQKRRRTGSKSIGSGSSAMESNTSTSMSSCRGGHLAGVLEHGSSIATVISPALRGDQLQMMQNSCGQQEQHASYAYNPMAYFGHGGNGGGDPNQHGGINFGAQLQTQHQHHHPQQQQQQHHHANSIGGMPAADVSMAWNGGMSPQNPTQSLFGMSPTSSTAAAGSADRSGGFGYPLISQSAQQQQYHHQYPHMMPPQEIPAQEQRW